jgi:hypothetical protein
MATALLSTALGYAKRGWKIFPCQPRGKKPLTSNGFKAATSDTLQVSAWWRAGNFNIGLDCGGSGVMAIDVDGDAGEATLAALERKHGPLPPSVEAITGGGGRHVYFRAPKVAVKNSVGKLGNGLDIRSAGGYTILPPSTHATGAAYVWSVDSAHAFAECPDWLLDLATAVKTPVAGSAEIMPPATDWAEFIRVGAAEGCRNDRMTRLVGMLMTRHDVLTVEQIALAINAMSFRPPLPPDEVETIVDSIAQAESRKRTAL